MLFKTFSKLQHICSSVRKNVRKSAIFKIKTPSYDSLRILGVLMVQMAGIEPARFIQPQDFKNFTPSVTYYFLALVIVGY